MEEIEKPQVLASDKLRIATAILLFMGIFVLSLGVGFFYFSKGESSGEDVKIIEGGEETPGEIVVDVDGAVAKPGVYHLKQESRVSDAVEIAGGLSENADRQKINLAAKISDGQKIVIAEAGKSTSGSVVGLAGNNLIDINSASPSLLDSLPGVGPVTSGKIISGRPYSTVDELLAKKAVSDSVFEKIKDLVSAN